MKDNDSYHWLIIPSADAGGLLTVSFTMKSEEMKFTNFNTNTRRKSQPIYGLNWAGSVKSQDKAPYGLNWACSMKSQN